jgi:hypothetical protein
VVKPLSNKSQRVLDLWAGCKALPASAIAERLGLHIVHVSQIIHAARKRCDPRADWRA